MKKTLIFIVACAVLLGGLTGYILGQKPFSNASKTNTQQDSNTKDGDSAAEDAETLPSFDSLLLTPDTNPLPLNLQAGVFYDVATADQMAIRVSKLGYPATVRSFAGPSSQRVYVVILDPFKNEANLQLAQYELMNKANISTKRVVTPPSD